MKSLLISLLLISNVVAYSQMDSIPFWTDSVKVIDLREVSLSSKSKSQTDRLSDFYRGNLSSTLEDVLARLPEVSLVKRGSYGLEPTLRSFSGAQVNVLLDGMRIHGACTDKMDPVTIYIETGNLESMELQTGNRGFAAGSSIGGSFNFKIEQPQFDNRKISGMVSSGFNTTSNGNFESIALNYGSTKFALRAAGTYRKNDNYKAAGGKEIYFSQYEKVNYSLGAKIRLGNEISLRADFIGDDGFNIGYPALPMDVGYAAARIASLTLQRVPGHGNVGWQFKIYGNYIRHFMDDTNRPEVHMHMDMPGKSKTVGFWGEALIRLSEKSRLELRADGASTDLHASMTMFQDGAPPMFMLTWPDNRRNQFGASAILLVEPVEKWSFRFTGRSDLFISSLLTEESKNHVEIFSKQTGPTQNITGNISVEATRTLGKYGKASASAGFSQRMASASEQYGFYLFNANDGYDYIGNPELKKESALNGELNIQVHKNRSRAKFSGFVSLIKDYITAYIDPSISTMTYGANGVKRYLNENNAIVAGLEGSALIPLTTSLGYVTTFRYVAGKNGSGDPLPGISPFKTSQSLQWMKNNSSLKAEVELSTSQNQVNLASGEDRTPGFAIFHFRAAHEFVLKKKVLVLQGGIENIADKGYHEHNDWGNIPRQGRNIYLQMRVSF